MYKVRINWKLGQDTDDWWDGACLWIMHEFGLPGYNYETEITQEHMIFNFKKKEDAALTALRWGNE